MCSWLAEVQTHALESFPNESVGVLMNGQYKPLDNVSKSPEMDYRLSVDDKIFLSDNYKVITYLIHSHTVLDNTPSPKDIIACHSSKIPFGIIGTDGKTTTEFKEV